MLKLTLQLLFMGEFLCDGLGVRELSSHITLHKPDRCLFLMFYPCKEDNTIFFIKSTGSVQVLSINGLVSCVNYDTMHWRLMHPSHNVLKHARDHTNGFPQIILPHNIPVCRSYAKGKMPLCPFCLSVKRALPPFQIIYSNLKSFPIASYRKDPYFARFFDNCTSHMWLYFLKKKNATLLSMCQFLVYVEN